jgi:hypothetical protein
VTPQSALLIKVCGAILNNILNSRLAAETNLSPEMRRQVIRSALDLPKNLTAAETAVVMEAYASGIRSLFIMFVPFGGLCFLLSLFVVEAGLSDDSAKETNSDATDTPWESEQPEETEQGTTEGTRYQKGEEKV